MNNVAMVLGYTAISIVAFIIATILSIIIYCKIRDLVMKIRMNEKFLKRTLERRWRKGFVVRRMIKEKGGDDPEMRYILKSTERLEALAYAKLYDEESYQRLKAEWNRKIDILNIRTDD